jgi:transglutaminase-like putative cysteine protease/Tfp pilus assembly protein PilF
LNVFLRRAIFVACQSCLFLNLLFLPASPRAEDVWDGPAFSAAPDALRQAAADIKSAKDTVVTVLLNEQRMAFDFEGKSVETRHMIYRIESEAGVKGWAETSTRWEPWRQERPQIKARVITSDGAVHVLDPKTLNDVPVHESDPDLYSDRRAYGGPLPAIAVGAIVEEEISIRDTAPFFTGGTVQRRVLARSVPVYKSRIFLSHPESSSLRYLLRLLPDAAVRKSSENGQETVTIENGLLAPYPEGLSHLPADVAPYAEVEFGTGASWQGVAQEYARLANEKLRLADVQPLLAKINTKSGSRTEIIGRIVAALHKSVRYTGVEFDQASLVPQFPEETLKRKYGDCKDKATLLAAMLRASGIPASLALLDTGPGQDINVELPGMGMFDHAIVYLPASGGEGEMWIDATDNYARPGDLPFMDYGRWALIVDEKTTALKKIPELTAEQSLHRELREFTLAEFGLADIVEKDEQTGPRESEYRAFYSRDAKEVRQNSESYVKREYLADTLTALNHGDLEDVAKPFSVTFVTKGKRGSTDYESAVMAIRIEDLFFGLPQYFTSDDADDKEKEKNDKDEERAERKQPRTFDWQIQPFVNEWDYKITAPPGFKLRALPPAKVSELGTARFIQKYSANADGTVVDAVLRFESGKPRLTVTEAKVLRDAVVRVEKTDPVFITFDQVAYSLIAAGKIKEGLAAYHELVQLHPKEALHRIQLARALLDAGLAESARSVAQEGTALEPSSAQAYSTLAWILQHDLLGRRLKKGFDYNGAIVAYRKAKELDPKGVDIRANLAILLEHDPDGRRYTAQAHLREAITEFQELKKLNEEAGRNYDDNVLYDLWYARDFKGLAEAVSPLPATETRRAFVIAGAAVEQGGEAALKKSVEITTDEEGRRKALTTAGWLLVRLHTYSEAADMLMAGARGQANETQIAPFAANLKKTKPREAIKIGDSDPRAAIQHLFSLIFSESQDYEQIRRLISKDVLRSFDSKKDKEDFRRAMYQLRVELERDGVPLDVIGDVLLTNSRYSVEGSDSLGYKVTMESPGARPQEMFVVREDGQYKILEFSLEGQKPPENLGWQALERLKSNDLAGARQWLDWAREQIHMSSGDDPLAGNPFPHFWTKGQEGDVSAARTAALVLIPSKELKGDDLKTLLRARESAGTDRLKSELDVVAVAAYSAQERWSDMIPIAERLLQAYPDSAIAFDLVSRAYARTARLDDWDKLIRERIAKHPDEADYTRMASQAATYRGDYAKARQVIKDLIDRSKATEDDLNSYAWAALYLPAPIQQDSIEAAERANQLSKNQNFSIMHTLACVYARAGKPAQARELLLKAMEGSMEEPESAIWLALGEIAEQYGETDAARIMYARVEKQEIEGPTSNYTLAQQRLGVLKSVAPAATKTVSH